MTGPRRDVAGLVAALLRDLPAADLAALVEGRARLAVVPLDAAAPGPLAGHPLDATPSGPLAGHPLDARPARTDAHPPRTGPPGTRRSPSARPAAAPAPAAGPRAVDPAGNEVATAAGRAASTADPARARAALAAMSRRDDGTAYLTGWTARDLRALAASLGLRGVTGLRKAELVDRIVDRTIGYRLASTAIRRL
ncbi:Rho termination factor, N-terminal domain [Micromonospora citrea]|uniref:Rho termination factor, N-terminal domain n=1 Tax=Micromonospora citrea TaxID=47855 RepID=A0A1C6UHA9_9ACTN|nr:Rho termination factor N-terminal domain-containing protein [Micromonospora citrea]SCL53338.1 Rho termination factor, N-terminal domain [Micromonospora citrea]